MLDRIVLYNPERIMAGLRERRKAIPCHYLPTEEGWRDEADRVAAPSIIRSGAGTTSVSLATIATTNYYQEVSEWQ